MSVSKNLWLFWLPCFLTGDGLAYVYEEYSDLSYNEISDGDQQETSTTSNPCQSRDQTRWDKLFTTLENSHMRQNMLLHHTEELGKVLQHEISKLSGVDSSVCLRTLEDTCKGIDERVNLKLDQVVAQLRESVDKYQAQNNLTLQQLVEMSEEQGSRLIRLEGFCTQGPELHQVAMKHFPDYIKEQDTSSGNGRKLEKALINLHKAHTPLALFQHMDTHRFIPSGCEMALLFPARSSRSFAKVKLSASLAMSSLSICLWAKVAQKMNRTIVFSYGTRAKPQELQLLLAHDSVLFVVGGEASHRLEAHNVVLDGQWGHYCATWSSEQGLASLWADGEKVASVSGMAEGHCLPNGGSIFLGQERGRNRTHQGLDPAVGFTGKMTALNLWDHVLEADSIKEYANVHGTCDDRGNVIGWGVTEIIPHGGVQYIN